jgi:hypothetical protein
VCALAAATSGRRDGSVTASAPEGPFFIAWRTGAKFASRKRSIFGPIVPGYRPFTALVENFRARLERAMATSQGPQRARLLSMMAING